MAQYYLIKVKQILNIYNQQEIGKESEQMKEVSQACLYFSKPLASPIKQKIFQQHLTSLQKYSIHKLIQYKIDSILVERYFEIVKNESSKLEEYLIIKFIHFLEKLIKVQSKRSEEELIILLWCNVSYLKKCSPQNQFKQVIKAILSFISAVYREMVRIPTFQVEKIYPQLSASLMQLIVNSHLLNHIIFDQSLSLLGEVLDRLFSSRKEKKLNEILTYEKIKSFDQQCFLRLQPFLKKLINKIPQLEYNYQEPINKFALKLLFHGQKIIKIICPLAILTHLTGDGLQYRSNFSTSVIKMIDSALTQEFITILDSTNSNILQRTNNLQKLVRLANMIDPNEDQVKHILLKFTNILYLIQNNKPMVIPHSPIHIAHLTQILGNHSFSTYPIPLNSLEESLNFECQRILLTRIGFAQTSLANISLLKKILLKIPSKLANQFLSQLLEGLEREQNQYLTDMSFTKFCQFLTKIIIIYWILKKNDFKPRAEIALSIFQVLNSCQAIRILQPSFEQQQILICFTLMICYYCHNSFINPSSLSQLNSIKKIRLKINMLEMVINNSYQQSYIIKLASYYILLSEAAPDPISNMLQSLQATLINRNINNIKFIISLIKYCALSPTQCESLAQRFMQYPGSQELLKILLPSLKTQTIRKCLLSATTQKGKWIHMLCGNTKLLYNRNLEQGQDNESKIENFYMNDGPNVQISNALGVLILELGDRWEIALGPQSSVRQPCLDLLIELTNTEVNMVFFKTRFTTIIERLKQIIEWVEVNNSSGKQSRQRTLYKIYKILQKIPAVNYTLYEKEQRKKEKERKQIYLRLLPGLLHSIQKKHKKLQLQYLMSQSNKSAEEMYKMSNQIITRISEAIQNLKEIEVNEDNQN